MLKPRVNQLVALLVIAVLFGGGGIRYGLANFAVQLSALIILAVNFQAVRNFYISAPRSFCLLVTAAIALPLFQLIPLPPSIWMAMPGRELVSEALSYVNERPWFGTTVNTARTFVAFTGLIAPFAVIVTGWQLEDTALHRIVSVIIGLALLSIALGTVQVLGTDGTGLLYPELEMPGVMFGFFANRNSTGLFLVCCLLLLSSLPAGKGLALGMLTKALAAILLVTGVVLTQSRTSIVLLALPLALAGLRAASARFDNSSSQSVTAPRVLLVMGIAIAVLGGMISTMGDTRLGTVFARFEKTEEQRILTWEDAQFTAQRYWPVGSGMATFDEVFQVDESLENITPRKAGRAHNDYLEIAIEAGAIGLALIAAWTLWITLATWRAIATPQRWPALAGTGILLAIALQSALDYPLRNQTMLCLAAFAVLLVAPQSVRKSAKQELAV